ncbi:cytochrome c oxidase subunit II [Xinfangfangia sp. D13-10-4-6]|uniref:cytochrome c oxidase subunit II n=1 Tax=Pseudogemmobacter hezensis TaxID=2737662 RepID=UPI0015539B20|nr:cytochrome c oxidase subunit II [Pseudogemmobacter hezensis]NPD15211.1 cytochrome c oxidase subunit II [Pseudogemmobacter hezensis]
MRVMTTLKGAALAGFAALTSGSAMAQTLEIIGQPHDRGVNFQTAATELAHDKHFLDNMVLWIIGVVTLFVVLLLLVVILRFNSRSNPVPRKFTHNTPLEIAWTIVPIVILIFIGVYSLPTLVKQQTFPAGDVVIKVTGNQWYWTYEYPQVNDGEGGDPLQFDSYMIGGTNWGGNSTLTAATEKGLVDAGYDKEHFLLATDTAMVVPVNKKILLQITGADVIHSWTIPAFAVKQDAVPGRMALAWFEAEKEGIYFGQCSELCGKDHAYMPITVKVVSQADYDAWTRQALDGDVVLKHTAVVAAAN